MNAFQNTMSVMDEAQAVDPRRIDCPIDAESALAIARDRACDHEAKTWDMAAQVLRQFVEPGDRSQPNGDSAAQLCELKAAIRRAQQSVSPFAHVERAALIGIDYDGDKQ